MGRQQTGSPHAHGPQWTASSPRWLAAGPDGRVIGVDMTDARLAKARRLSQEAGFAGAEFREGYIETPPVDCVISNGVINLSPDKPAVFAAAARGRGSRAATWRPPRAGRHRDRAPAPGWRHLRRRAVGRLDRRAVQRDAYREAIEAAGFEIETWRQNSECRFVSERADNATQKYGVTSISLLARRR